MATTKKKMISASMALSVIDEPQVGPTVVTLILSTGTVVVVVLNVVVVVAGTVVDDPTVGPSLAGLVVVVVALTVVVVVGGVLGAWAAVSVSIAFCTLSLIFCCASADSLLMSDWTV